MLTIGSGSSAKSARFCINIIIASGGVAAYWTRMREKSIFSRLHSACSTKSGISFLNGSASVLPAKSPMPESARSRPSTYSRPKLIILTSFTSCPRAARLAAT